MTAPGFLRRLLRPRTAAAAAIAAAAQEGDVHEESPLLECSAADVERWNGEWIEYLRREWQVQLLPHTAFTEKPPLPADPLALIELSTGLGRKLALYCDRDALADQRVMELGCGCGNLGKLIARYVRSYLGADFSTLALQIARLVSPANCTYVHVGDRAGLSPFFGQVDTVIGRYFWIHQNLRLARRNLEFLELFLRPGGRLYCDFYWPNPDVEQFIVLSPGDALSKAYPSATFRYTSEDVQELIAGRPFRILRETISLGMQRRYVVLERQPGS
ncbi:MAG TPA: class I SAM-dependent methyltransferase [Thermoanaerobaculia bacterium]|nr:class I SAM-dependent methyltransferase [Thermoanaerobaculia bacterium]